MVGVNSYTYRMGTVAVFATLFVAICVNGEKGCSYNFENLADFVECNDLKNAWKVNAEGGALSLSLEQGGCLETKDAVLMNASSRVLVRFSRETPDVNHSFTLRLKPTEGNCPDEQCVWKVTGAPQSNKGSWAIAEQRFPLKSARECKIQLEVTKGKGNFLLDYILVAKAVEHSSEQRLVTRLVPVLEDTGTTGGGAHTTAKPSFAPCLAEVSKHLLITSASVLTVNNFLN